MGRRHDLLRCRSIPGYRIVSSTTHFPALICIVGMSLAIFDLNACLFHSTSEIRPVPRPRPLHPGIVTIIPSPRRKHLCHHGRSCRALILPVGLQDTNSLVVPAETVDSGFDQNESELGVLVLAVALEVLADGDGLGTKSSADLECGIHVGRTACRGRLSRTFLINM